MNTETNGGSATDKTATSSASNSNQSVTDKTSSEKYVTVDALLDEKNRRRALEDKLRQYEEADKNRNVKKLEEEKNYKEILSLKDQENETLKQQITKFKSDEQERHKLTRVRSELSKFGLDSMYEEAALKLIDRSRLKYDEDTNTVIGAELEAKALYDQYKDLGFFKKSAGPINQSAPNTINANKSFSSLSREDKLKLIQDKLK